MPDRASLEEVKDFANKVRAAGGGNPIDALMPAVPENPHACLIAKNLNFNCEVTGGTFEWVTPEGERLTLNDWIMVVGNKRTRDKIAEGLELSTANRTRLSYRPSGERFHTTEYAVVLPPEIGQVAHDFDLAGGILHTIINNADAGVAYDELSENDALKQAIEAESDADERRLVLEMLPYIEDAAHEAYDLATAINEKGEIVL